MRRAVAGLALLLAALTVAAQTADDKPIVELNGGLTAQVISMSRDATEGRAGVTASVKITNPGTNYVFLIVAGMPSGVDDAGIAFQGTVSGVGWCRKEPGYCIGTQSAYTAFPMRQYTEIDPGTSVTAVFVMPTSRRAEGTKRVSLSAEMAFRVVDDLAKDAELTEFQKVQQVRMGNLGFDPVTVTSAPMPSRDLAQNGPPPFFHSGPAPAPVNRPLPHAEGWSLSWPWYAFPAVVAILAIAYGVREYRAYGEINAFAPLLLFVGVVGGVWLWFDYFIDHGGILGWPIAVAIFLVTVYVWRIRSIERHKREFAESLKYVDKTPVYGDSREASPDDERWGGL